MTASTDRTDPPMAEPGERKPGAADPRIDPSRRPTSATSNDEDEDEWRHEPIAPIDEGNPLKSLGKAVGDTVTGSGPDAATPTSTSTPKTTPPRSR